MPRNAPSVYDSAWRKVRLAALERDGWRCYFPGCEALADQGDHVIPVDEAPHLRLDLSNVRASCAKHNAGRVSSRLARMAKINRAPAAVRPW